MPSPLSHFRSACSVVTVAALALVACSSEAPADGTSPSGDGDVDVSSSAVTAALAATGFTVQEGRFGFLDMTQCCATSCAGNNPSSPYAAFYVPPAPGRAPEPNAEADGRANAFHLRADEAIVFVGSTPPEVRYFGFTPYLTDRAKLDGSRRVVAASLSETLNNLVIRTDAPAGAPVFGRRTAVVVAANATARKGAVDALVAAGFPLGAVNTLVLDPQVSRFGLDAAGDTFSVLFRVAVPRDPAALQTWMSSPGARVYRLTPRVPLAANPLAVQARPKDLVNTESALTPAVDRLRAAIVSANAGWVAQDIPVDDGVPDPQGCIDGTSVCAFDNRDTTYPGTNPRVLFASDDDFYVVYGVDHQVSGKTTYSNVSVYALEHLVGLKSVASPEYPGSAQRFLTASDPAAPKLFAWKIARRCGGDPYCMEVPKGGCPTGIENGKLGTLAFRTYLEPSTKTAPHPSTLVRDRILRFRRR